MPRETIDSLFPSTQTDTEDSAFITEYLFATVMTTDFRDVKDMIDETIEYTKASTLMAILEQCKLDEQTVFERISSEYKEVLEFSMNEFEKKQKRRNYTRKVLLEVLDERDEWQQIRPMISGTAKRINGEELVRNMRNTTLNVKRQYLAIREAYNEIAFDDDESDEEDCEKLLLEQGQAGAKRTLKQLGKQ